LCFLLDHQKRFHLLYFEHVLGGERKTYYVEKPRKEKKLPEVLSEREIGSMIAHVDNIKHKTIIVVLYSSGIRGGGVCRRKERLLKTCREVRRFLAQNQVRAYLSSIRRNSQWRKEKVVEVLPKAAFPARSTAIIPI
jgi:hypothetical protein